MIYSILIIVQVLVALSLVGLILLQHGKGADAGAAFGSGASGTVFGAKGSANFMSRATAGLATVFFLLSLALAYLVNGASQPTGSVTDQLSSKPAAQKTSIDSSKRGSSAQGDDDDASAGTTPDKNANSSSSSTAKTNQNSAITAPPAASDNDGDSNTTQTQN